MVLLGLVLSLITMFLFCAIPSYSFTPHSMKTSHLLPSFFSHPGYRNSRGLAVLATKTWIERYQSECQELQRIDRILSNRNLGSRKDVTSLFRQGRVKVQGKAVRSGAEKFPVNTLLSIDGRTVAPVRYPFLSVLTRPLRLNFTWS